MSGRFKARKRVNIFTKLFTLLIITISVSSYVNGGKVKFWIFGDSQKINNLNAGRYNDLMSSLPAEAKRRNIDFILQTGDITEDDKTSNWERARSGWRKLDGIIPYIVNRGLGNNDGSANMNKYFPVSHYDDWSEYIGNRGGYAGAIAFQIRTSDANWLIISLKGGAGSGEENWSANLIKEYKKHNAILIQHDALGTSSVAAILAKNYDSVKFVFCGHHSAKGPMADRFNRFGNRYGHIVQCWHSPDKDDYACEVELDTTTGVVTCTYYSPLQRKYWSDPSSHFHHHHPYWDPWKWTDIKFITSGTIITPTPPPPPVDIKVTVYQHDNYQGWSARFGVGNYDISAFAGAGAVNDDASSVKVSAGYQVELFLHGNFGGESLILTADDSSLGDNGFNDTISSLKVSPVTLVTPTPTPTPPPTPTAPPVHTFVSLSSPAAGAAYEPGEPVKMAAAASPDITVVRFWVTPETGAPYVINTDSEAPYQFTSSTLSAGTYTIGARGKTAEGTAYDSRDISITIKKSTVVPGVGSIIALRAVNGKYVSAAAGDRILIADRDTAGSYEKFEIVEAGIGFVALKCLGNGKYVCAEKAGASPLVANRERTGSWEKFFLIVADAQLGLITSVNGKYVCAEEGGSKSLIANRDRFAAWEKFTWEIK